MSIFDWIDRNLKLNRYALLWCWEEASQGSPLCVLQLSFTASGSRDGARNVSNPSGKETEHEKVSIKRRQLLIFFWGMHWADWFPFNHVDDLNISRHSNQSTAMEGCEVFFSWDVIKNCLSQSHLRHRVGCQKVYYFAEIYIMIWVIFYVLKYSFIYLFIFRIHQLPSISTQNSTVKFSAEIINKTKWIICHAEVLEFYNDIYHWYYHSKVF